MIELSYETLHYRGFREAFQKMSSAQLRAPAAMRIKHLVKKISDADFVMQQKFRERFGGKYIKLNERGDFIPDPKSPIGLALVDNSPEFVKQFFEAEQDFLNQKVVIDAKKISSKTLEEVGTFSAQELIALEPIYVELSEA